MKIIVLDSTAKSIKAVLASSVATSNPDFVVAYADTSDNTFSELSSDGQLNGTTDVTLVSAPASGVKRAIKSITIYNRDTAAVTVSIKFDNGGTQRILQRVQLVSGETWHSDELTKLSPGGSDTQVQFNDLGTLAGSSNFTYNKTTSVLTLGANPVLTAGTANGVLYLNGSKVATTGSALTFDGSTLTETNATSAANLVLNNTVSGKQTYINLNSGATVLNSVYRPATTNDFQFDANYGSIVWGIGSAGTATEQMRLTSTGLGIGLGGSSPAVKLDVVGFTNITNASTVLSGTAKGTLRLYDSTAMASGVGAGLAFLGQATTGSGAYTTAGSIQAYKVNGTSGNDAFGLQFTTRSNGSGCATVMSLDDSGNLGLGVAPSAINQGRAIELLTPGMGLWNGSGSPSSIYMTGNAYWNSGFKYGVTGQASHYYQYLGQHVWSTAPSGTANTAITFTQAMTLDASGRLLVGTTAKGVYGGNTAEFRGANIATPGGNDTGNLTIFTTDSQAADVGAVLSLGGIYASTIPYAFGAIAARKSNSTSGNAEGYLQFYTTSSSNAIVERARITSGGDFRVKGAGTAGSTDAFQVSGSAPADAARITSGGSLLVGRTNRQNSGTIEALGTGTQAFVGQVTNNGNSVFQAFNSSGSATFYVVGSGEIYSTSTTITAISDASQKENINPIAYGLNAICNLRPVKFDFKQGCGSEQKGLLGFIAQDVEPIIPELVKSFGNEGLKGLKTGDMIPVLVKAIQEQQALITALTARVAALEGTQP